MTAIPSHRGHFELESGLHSDRWLLLEQVFVDPAGLDSACEHLASAIAAHAPTAICGPLVGGAFLAQRVARILGVRFYYSERSQLPVSGQPYSAQYRIPGPLRESAATERFALLDDAISGGSATLATLSDLGALGASACCVGALWLLGDRAEPAFIARGLPLLAFQREPLPLWTREACPLCARAVPIDPLPA